jgi:hypothetical protein
MDDGVMEDGCMVKENGNMSKLGNINGCWSLIPYVVILCLFGMLCNMEYHNFSFVSYKVFKKGKYTDDRT